MYIYTIFYGLVIEKLSKPHNYMSLFLKSTKIRQRTCNVLCCVFVFFFFLIEPDPGTRSDFMTEDK